MITRAHEIEAVPNSGGGFTHRCHVCGAVGVGLAPQLPCPGPPLPDPAPESLRSSVVWIVLTSLTWTTVLIAVTDRRWPSILGACGACFAWGRWSRGR